MAYKKGSDGKWRGIKREQPDWYQKTEILLYSYPGMSSRIDMLEMELEEVKEKFTPKLIGNYEIREGKVYRVGNKMEDAIVNRIESREVKRLEKKIRQTKRMKRAIENAVENLLTQEEKDIVRWLYWEYMGWEEVCEILNLSRYPFYTRKNRIMTKLGWAFGYISDKELGLKAIKKTSLTCRCRE